LTVLAPLATMPVSGHRTVDPIADRRSGNRSACGFRVPE